MINSRLSKPQQNSLTKRVVSIFFLTQFLFITIFLNTTIFLPPAYTYQTPPTITDISPSEGYNWQETAITITGTNFVTSTTVTLGNLHLTPVNFISSNTLTAIVPADLPAGAYTLTVTNPDSQNASLVNAFMVLQSGDGSLGSWQSANPMTTRRSGLAVVTSGNYIYALGGDSSGNDYLDTVERAVINADGTLGAWQTVNPMTAKRFVLAAVVSGDYIYALGGVDGGGNILDTVERAIINADGTLGVWQVVNPMTSERAAHTAVVSGSYIYALGGIGGGHSLDTVERAMINADGTLGTWEAVNPLTAERDELASVVSGGYIYVLGGYNDSGTLDTVERVMINADGTLGVWEVVNRMTARRSGLAAVVSGGYIYAVGGFDGGGNNLDTVERVVINADGTLGAWQAVNPMSVGRSRLAAVVSGDYLYALGGVAVGGPYLDTVEQVEINQPRLTSFSPIAISSDQSTMVNINGANILPPPILSLGDSNLTSGFVSTTTLTTTIPSGLASGWYSATITSGDGRTATLAHAVRVDGPGPIVIGDYSVSINEGALFTNQIAVTLTIGSQNDTALMQVSNDGGFAGAQWETYTSHKNWQITQFGNYVIPRVVYVRYKDIEGNISSTFQDDIILDVTPPSGGLQIIPDSLENLAYPNTIYSVNHTEDNHSAYLPLIISGCINCTAVALNLWATDDVSGVGQMMLSNEPNFSQSYWEPFTTQKIWWIPSPETPTIYIKFRDNAGNESIVYTND